MAETLIIKAGPDFIKIEIITDPINQDDDEDWLNCNIEIRFGGFRGSFRASLQRWDFHYLHEGFKTLYNNLKYNFEYEAIENQIHFKCIGDGLGHVEMIGSVIDECGRGNELSFIMQFDQSYLPEIINQLTKIIKVYPHSL